MLAMYSNVITIILSMTILLSVSEAVARPAAPLPRNSKITVAQDVTFFAGGNPVTLYSNNIEHARCDLVNSNYEYDLLLRAGSVLTVTGSLLEMIKSWYENGENVRMELEYRSIVGILNPPPSPYYEKVKRRFDMLFAVTDISRRVLDSYAVGRYGLTTKDGEVISMTCAAEKNISGLRIPYVTILDSLSDIFTLNIE